MRIGPGAQFIVSAFLLLCLLFPFEIFLSFAVLTSHLSTAHLIGAICCLSFLYLISADVVALFFMPIMLDTKQKYLSIPYWAPIDLSEKIFGRSSHFSPLLSLNYQTLIWLLFPIFAKHKKFYFDDIQNIIICRRPEVMSFASKLAAKRSSANKLRSFTDSYFSNVEQSVAKMSDDDMENGFILFLFLKSDALVIRDLLYYNRGQVINMITALKESEIEVSC